MSSKYSIYTANSALHKLHIGNNQIYTYSMTFKCLWNLFMNYFLNQTHILKNILLIYKCACTINNAIPHLVWIFHEFYLVHKIGWCNTDMATQMWIYWKLTLMPVYKLVHWQSIFKVNSVRVLSSPLSSQKSAITRTNNLQTWYRRRY